MLNRLGRPTKTYPPSWLADTRLRERLLGGRPRADEGTSATGACGAGHTEAERRPSWHRGGREEVSKALRAAYREGSTGIVIDEIRDLVGPKPPGLGLGALVDSIWRKGRARYVSVIAGTQAPRWAGSSFYDQATYVFAGSILDDRARQRIDEIGGNTKRLLRAMDRLPDKHFVLIRGREMVALQAPSAKARTTESRRPLFPWA